MHQEIAVPMNETKFPPGVIHLEVEGTNELSERRFAGRGKGRATEQVNNASSGARSGL